MSAAKDTVDHKELIEHAAFHSRMLLKFVRMGQAVTAFDPPFQGWPGFLAEIFVAALADEKFAGLIVVGERKTALIVAFDAVIE
jgi:hypothetical protein